jgi:hypothetical protein
MFDRTLAAALVVALGAAVAWSEPLPVQLAQQAVPSQPSADASHGSEHEKHQRIDAGGATAQPQPGQLGAPSPAPGMGQGGMGGMMPQMHMRTPQSGSLAPPPSASPSSPQSGVTCAAGTTIQMDAQGHHYCK